MTLSQSRIVTRPLVELLGYHPGYAFAGVGVSTAVGNFTTSVTDLSFPRALLGLLDWTRTYNSLSAASGLLGAGSSSMLSAALAPAEPGGQLGSGPVTFADADGRVLTFVPGPAGGYTRPQDLDADLAAQDDGTFTLSFLSGEAWTFDRAGRLTGRSREGQEVTVTYDPAGRAAGLAHSLGHQLILSYDGSDRLSALTASDGREVSYSYDANGTLSAVTDPGGGVTSFEAAASGGPIATITDADGNILLRNTYDDAGRVTHQDFPTGSPAGADFGYDDASGATTVTARPSGAAMVFQADAFGRMASVTDPDQNRATFAYDAEGRLTQAVSPGGTQLTQTHDAAGNLLTSTFGGATTTATFDGQNRPATTTDALGGRTTYTYSGGSRIPAQVTEASGGIVKFTSSGGLITTVTDPDGYTTTFGHDAAGNPVTVTNPAGEITRFGFDAAGRVISSALPSGATSLLTRDAAGRVTSVTDADGHTTSFQYSAAGRLLATTHPDGTIATRTYDAAGQLATSTDPLGRVTAYGYDAEGNPESVTAPGGAVTRYGFDRLGRLTSRTDPVGTATSYTYDADGNQLTEHTPTGTSRATYDQRGNVLIGTDRAGATTHYRYDAADQLVSVTDPVGGVWLTSYSASGDVTSSTDPSGAVTRRVVTPAGRLASVTDPLGRQTRFGRDAGARLATVTDPLGGITEYGYDQDGRRISVISPAGLRTGFGHDPAGQLVSVTNPRGWITRTEYSPRGQKKAVIAPSGATTRFRYDPAGQLTETVDANGSLTQYAYDDAGNLTIVTDPKGAVSRYAYDAARRLTAATDPLGQVTRYGYDAVGDLITVTEPSGHVTHLAFDADRRVIHRTADDAVEVSYAYDDAGRRSSMTDATGITHYAYDAAGRLVRTISPDGAVTSAGYDSAGELVSLTYPGGLVVRREYDGNGRLTALQDSRARQVAYALDADGRLLTEQLPGRNARRYHYDQGLLTHFLALHDGQPIATVTLTHDADGRVARQDSPGFRRHFRYDLAGQLIRVTHERDSAPSELHVRYDAAGNRISTRLDGAETRFHYDAADQLLACETEGRRAEFRYDSSGRLTEQRTGQEHRLISYDGFGLPAVVTMSHPGRRETARPVFNGDGLLSSVTLTTAAYGHTECSASARYLWSAGSVPQILRQDAEPALDDAEADRSGRLSADFVYGYNRVLASWAGGSAVFHQDEFGSALRTGQTSAWAQAPAYDAFGRPSGEHRGGEPRPEHRDGPELPRFGYRGELALGSLIYLRARTYDASLGRFLTRDPLRVPPVPGQVANPYTYAANDPINRTDPRGEWPFPPVLSLIRTGLSDLGHHITHTLSRAVHRVIDTNVAGTGTDLSELGILGHALAHAGERGLRALAAAPREIAQTLVRGAHDVVQEAEHDIRQANRIGRAAVEYGEWQLRQDAHDALRGVHWGAQILGVQYLPTGWHDAARVYRWVRSTARLPDYMSLALNVRLFPGIVMGVTVTETRQGRVYWGPDLGASTSPFSLAPSFGWIDQSRPATPGEVDNFVNSFSMSAMASAGPVSAGEALGDPQTRMRNSFHWHYWATEIGPGGNDGDPGLNVFGSYSHPTRLNLGGWNQRTAEQALRDLLDPIPDWPRELLY